MNNDLLTNDFYISIDELNIPSVDNFSYSLATNKLNLSVCGYECYHSIVSLLSIENKNPDITLYLIDKEEQIKSSIVFKYCRLFFTILLLVTRIQLFL